MNKSEIIHKLQTLKFDTTVLQRYEEKHRHYHTVAHVSAVIDYLIKSNQLNDELFLAAVYHDAIYDPKQNNNEDLSAELFSKDAEAAKLDEKTIAKIVQIIRDTKTHKASFKESEIFIEADLSIFKSSFADLMNYEHQIFKEFQFVDYREYKPKRLEVLRKFNTDGKLDLLIEYVSNRKPLIGVFCGSFNPFHKGHYNVLEKAERIFDKVIIAFGKNPDKQERRWPIPKIIQYHQMEEYNGLMTDFVETLGTEVVVVRGLRNSTDFQYEQNQYRYIQELMPGIRIINIFCDKEFEHISSSGIRTLEKYNKHHSYLLE
ncbi:MAG: adenylyltransferase/cytidyltransferase family protein [Sphingobacteriaceae bacterium]|nr:adenylyltransferase/cytidyltransferase family protein [Sphingobacteriaceae bacterium]